MMILLSLPVARYTEEFVCSVVLGKDLVPRLAIGTMDDLKVKLIKIIKECSLPKVGEKYLMYLI